MANNFIVNEAETQRIFAKFHTDRCHSRAKFYERLLDLNIMTALNGASLKELSVKNNFQSNNLFAIFFALFLKTIKQS